MGVATGRGKSVKEDPRRAIPPENWKDTHLGYYNGAELSLLSDDKHPLPAEEPCKALFGVDKALSSDPTVSNLATCERRRSQLSIHPKLRSSSEALWNRVSQLAGAHSVKAMRSSHSIDVMPLDVTKLSLLSHMQSRIRPATEILTIGDKGRWPGNDCELLSRSFSLSVDEISSDPNSCWNIAPAGLRGTQATLYYFSCLRTIQDSFKFALADRSPETTSGRSVL